MRPQNLKARLANGRTLWPAEVDSRQGLGSDLVRTRLALSRLLLDVNRSIIFNSKKFSVMQLSGCVCVMSLNVNT